MIYSRLIAQRAELDVLQGIEEADWKKIHQISMELHDAKGKSTEGRLEEILNLLHQHGYDTVTEQDALLKGTDRFSLYAISRDQKNRHGSQRFSPTYFKPALLSRNHLRNYLSERLPDCMVPSGLLFVDEFPLGRNGKIDRSALVGLADNQNSVNTIYIAPRNSIEKIIVEIWSEVLGEKRVGIFDNFFDLGGHSLSVMLAVSRLRESLQIEIPVRDFFQDPTVSGLASMIQKLIAEQKESYITKMPRPIPSSTTIDEQLTELEKNSRI